jgi:hypothetical protein
MKELKSHRFGSSEGDKAAVVQWLQQEQGIFWGDDPVAFALMGCLLQCQ